MAFVYPSLVRFIKSVQLFVVRDVVFGLRYISTGFIFISKERLQKMYKGNVSPQEAYDQLNADPAAILIDVRTQPEWAFVGVPAIERVATISWQKFPSMQVNEEFVSAVQEMGLAKDANIFLICRSGARSAAAAMALADAGYTNCFNVSEGFEGDLDPARHRGQHNGWKARGLPWVQS